MKLASTSDIFSGFFDGRFTSFLSRVSSHAWLLTRGFSRVASRQHARVHLPPLEPREGIGDVRVARHCDDRLPALLVREQLENARRATRTSPMPSRGSSGGRWTRAC